MATWPWGTACRNCCIWSSRSGRPTNRFGCLSRAPATNRAAHPWKQKKPRAAKDNVPKGKRSPRHRPGYRLLRAQATRPAQAQASPATGRRLDFARLRQQISHRTGVARTALVGLPQGPRFPAPWPVPHTRVIEHPRPLLLGQSREERLSMFRCLVWCQGQRPGPVGPKPAVVDCPGR